MICKKCGNKFPTYIVVNKKKHNLCNRKFCFQCSPFKKHNTKNLVLSNELITEKVCTVCNKLKPLSEFYRRKNRRNGRYSECKICSSKRTKIARVRLKKLAVIYKGGKCEICGYKKCIKALEFHHRDPNKKDFALSDYRLYSKVLTDEIKHELDKCDLLCANCHRETEEDII